ncbi:MAG: hypothetical protein V5A46_03955 [Haloferacaceae archaeon]
MRRRALLSSLAAAPTAVAGCLSVGGGCSRGRTVTFAPVDAAEIAERDAVPADSDRPMLLEALLNRALSEGGVAIETVHRDPLGWLRYYRTDGAFYEIESTTLEEGDVTGPEYRLRRDGDVPDDPDPAETLQYGDLPFQDRLRVGEAVDYRPERLAVRDRDRAFESVPFVAGYLDPDVRAGSRLAAGVEASYLSVGDGEFAIDDRGEGTTTARRIAYAAERVADDANEFADVVLAERGATLDAPPAEAEELLRTVREEGGRLEVCDDEGAGSGESHREAADALEAYLADLESDVPGDVKYGRYEGEWYRVGVSEWVV